MKRPCLFLVGFLFIIIWSCDINNQIPDPIITDPVSFVTVTTFVDSGVIIDPSGTKIVPSGRGLEYKYSIKNGFNFKGVKINNQIFQPIVDGVINITPTTDTEIRVEAEPYPNYDLLVENYFYRKFIRIRQNGVIIDTSFYCTDINKMEKLILKSNLNTFVSDENGEMMQTSDWKFVDETHFSIGSQYFTIMILDRNNLEYSVEGFSNLLPCTYEFVYWRP